MNEKKLRPYMVYAYAPVNVKVLASTPEKAVKLALRAIDRTNPLHLDPDESKPIYLDDGMAAYVDKIHPPTELEHDLDREYADEERL